MKTYTVKLDLLWQVPDPKDPEHQRRCYVHSKIETEILAETAADAVCSAMTRFKVEPQQVTKEYAAEVGGLSPVIDRPIAGR